MSASYCYGVHHIYESSYERDYDSLLSTLDGTEIEIVEVIKGERGLTTIIYRELEVDLVDPFVSIAESLKKLVDQGTLKSNNLGSLPKGAFKKLTYKFK